MEIRFAILLPTSINRYAGKIAARVAKMGPNWFAVDNRKLKPHITLFSLVVKKTQKESLYKKVSSLLENEKQFKVKIDGFWADPTAPGYLAMKIKLSKRLRGLRQKIVQKLGARVNSPYIPHITLTKYRKENLAREVELRAKNVNKIFTVTFIGMCISDKYGQVYKILKKFKLK